MRKSFKRCLKFSISEFESVTVVETSPLSSSNNSANSLSNSASESVLFNVSDKTVSISLFSSKTWSSNNKYQCISIRVIITNTYNAYISITYLINVIHNISNTIFR